MWSHLVFHRIITCVLFYRLDFSQSSASVLRSLILRGAKWLVLRNTVNYGQAHNGSPNIFSSNVMYFLPPVVRWLCVCARACVHACILTRDVFQVSTDVHLSYYYTVKSYSWNTLKLEKIAHPLFMSHLITVYASSTLLDICLFQWQETY